MPLDKEQLEQKDDEVKNSKVYRLAIGVICLIMVLIAWWALVRVNTKLLEMRSNFWPFMKWALLVGGALLVILIVFIALFNFRGKQQQWDEHQEGQEK